MKPDEAASIVLKSYWDYSLPVNPVEIAEKLGLKVYMSDELGRLGGYYDQQEKEITINENDALSRQRFSVAHEIGHCVLGHGSSPRDNQAAYNQQNYSKKEFQANIFAAELLMPKDAMQVMVEIRGMKLATLCETFGVSEEAMTIRLRSLGYV
ncbi:MAG: ImmA/IrrE family metallo-endopeptidase [Desulfovibrio desulfuricans]|nr:ImmA/IrrE family metallo-endopeptidase [Desulfovibrio desulfuricans]